MNDAGGLALAVSAVGYGMLVLLGPVLVRSYSKQPAVAIEATAASASAVLLMCLSFCPSNRSGRFLVPATVPKQSGGRN